MSKKKSADKQLFTHNNADVEYDCYKADVVKERNTVEELKKNFQSFESNFKSANENLKSFLELFPSSYDNEDPMQRYIPKMTSEVTKFDSALAQYKPTAEQHQAKLSKREQRFEGVDEIFSVRDVEKKKYDRAYKHIRGLFDKMHTQDPSRLLKELDTLRSNTAEYNDTLKETKRYLAKIIEDGFSIYDKLYVEMFTDIYYMFSNMTDRFKSMNEITKEIRYHLKKYKRKEYKNTPIALDFDIDNYNPQGIGVTSILSSTSEAEDIEFPPNMPEEEEQNVTKIDLSAMRVRHNPNQVRNRRNSSFSGAKEVTPKASSPVIPQAGGRRNYYGHGRNQPAFQKKVPSDTGVRGGAGRGVKMAGMGAQQGSGGRGGMGQRVAPAYRSAGRGSSASASAGRGSSVSASGPRPQKMDPEFKKFMEKEWWYQNESAEQIGPISFREFKKKYKFGKIKKGWWVFATEFDDWVELSQQTKLLECLNSRY